MNTVRKSPVPFDLERVRRNFEKASNEPTPPPPRVGSGDRPSVAPPARSPAELLARIRSAALAAHPEHAPLLSSLLDRALDLVGRIIEQDGDSKPLQAELVRTLVTVEDLCDTFYVIRGR
jgi:hypothetical protein